ncbi:MAG: hypothetical protein HY735_13035 [Verrucomicrobia bacterium]|nr:hypothetical protein [Verrucomicrobiota bacterium]
MGYYSYLGIELQVKEGLEVEFLEALAKQRRHCEENDLRDGVLLDELRLVGRELTYDDFWCKWGDGLEFARFLAPFVETGNLRFEGEDGERWGYHFDGNGNVFALRWREEFSEQPIIRAESARIRAKPFRAFHCGSGRLKAVGKAMQ